MMASLGWQSSLKNVPLKKAPKKKVSKKNEPAPEPQAPPASEPSRVRECREELKNAAAEALMKEDGARVQIENNTELAE